MALPAGESLCKEAVVSLLTSRTVSPVSWGCCQRRLCVVCVNQALWLGTTTNTTTTTATMRCSSAENEKQWPEPELEPEEEAGGWR